MALKPLNSVAGFSVGETPSNVILGNGDITTNNFTTTGVANLNNISNVKIAGGSNAQVIQTDGTGNLSFVTIDTWRIQNGNSNVQVLANSNVTVSVSGNANIATFTSTGFEVAGYINAGNISANGNLSANNYLVTPAATDLIVAPGTQFTRMYSNVNPYTDAGYSLGNALARWNNVFSNTANVTGNITAGGVKTDNLYYANGNPWDLQQPGGTNTQIQFNDSDQFGGSANFTFDKTTNQLTVYGNGQFNNANLGNLATANFINVASNIVSNNLSINLELAGNTANFSGNVILPNLTVNATLNGNVANFTGNLTSLNANLGNLATANYINVANDLNVTGNITAGNIIGDLANGNSNVKVYSNSNVEISIGGVANIATFTGNSLQVVGNIQSTSGNLIANGNVVANGTFNGANANVTGEGLFGSVKTSNIIAPTGNLTISAAGSNENIILVPTGTGAVDVSLKNIIQLADPVNPRDAATKEYVDNTAQGLTVHAAVRVTSTTNLNATYANGGSTLTTIAIAGGKTIQFSAAHGLSVGDEISWTNSFNGLTNNNPYFVYSTPGADTITVKDGYFGAEVTTLTNGTGLSQASRANSGVGATLTNAGANAAISIDGVTLSATNRVLVQGQTNQFENGIYTVTTVGNGSTAWVLTRATDEDTYSPTSTTALGYGDYFFVQNGSSYAGSSYVVTTPIGEILFGYTNIAFSQFSAAGSYSAGNGIAITGTTISANIDGVTTDIVGGNIVVKSSANLTTPNVGDATFQSLTWNNSGNGNVTANNLSIGNIANISGNLTVAGNVQVTYDIDSNANIYSSNSDVTNFLTVGANITGNNITSNNLITTVTANVSGNLYVTDTANVGNLRTDNLLYANGAPWDLQQPAGSNTYIQYNNANSFGASANFTFNEATNVLNLTGDANISNAVVLGNTTTTWATVTTTAITANQTIASFSVTGITGIEYLVKGIDANGKYSVATVQAVTDGTSVDYSVFGTVALGGTTGSLAVNVVGGFVRLQVTPSSSNSTVWTTQYRLI
jgi:hypothetical protein